MMMASLVHEQQGEGDSCAEQAAAKSSDKDAAQTRQWLHSMARFCEELQEFLAAVPPTASLASYATMDGEAARQYPHLAQACSQERYMYGIDYARHAKEIEAVYCMGVQACRMLNKHPALGVFQGIPETRIEIFFERPLNMCMALGVEHGLSMHNRTRQQQQQQQALLHE